MVSPKPDEPRFTLGRFPDGGDQPLGGVEGSLVELGHDGSEEDHEPAEDQEHSARREEDRLDPLTPYAGADLDSPAGNWGG